MERQRNKNITIASLMLQNRLGQIPVTTLNQIEALPLSKLEDLGQVFFQFNSLEQLNQWLEN